MDDEQDERTDRPEEESSGEYPKDPGASKMGALERIGKSLRKQDEGSPDHDESDARQGDGSEDG